MRPRTSGILAVALLAAAVHTDWHLARPHHSPLSGHWPQHWLFGMAVFAALGWYLSLSAPGIRWRRSALIIGAGLFIGQILEPLWEGMSEGVLLISLRDGMRWTFFGEFLGAGLLMFLLVMAWRERVREPGEARSTVWEQP